MGIKVALFVIRKQLSQRRHERVESSGVTPSETPPVSVLCKYGKRYAVMFLQNCRRSLIGILYVYY